MKFYWVQPATGKSAVAHAIRATVPLVDIVRSSSICWNVVVNPVESHEPRCKNCLNRMGKEVEHGRREQHPN
jgi:hypothetical protein